MKEDKQSKQPTGDIRNATKDLPDYLKEIVTKAYKPNDDSCRAHIVTTVAYMDDLVVKLLKQSLVVSSTKGDDLFDDQCPLANSGARILLAYRMGLISNDLRWLLTQLTKLRNSAAHTHDEVRFDQIPVKDKIAEMSKRLKVNDENDKEKYQTIMTLVFVTLHNLAKNSTIPPTPKPEGIYQV